MEEKFGVVLVAGLAFFGFLFILDQGFQSAEPVETDKVTFAKQSFGAVGQSNPDFRTINFGDFTVGEARGNIQAYYTERTTISDSWVPLSSSPLWFQYNATQPRDAKVSFEVLGRRGSGTVYVNVNGETVFNEALVATGTPEVTVPAELLHPGMNSFEIGVSSGFLQGSSYSIEEVEVTVNDRKFHDFKDSFNLYQYEVEDYIGSPLTFSITDSIKTAPLRIFVNGKQVYSKEQVAVQGEEVEITPTNADLHPGSNSITFETDRQAKYVIDDAHITAKYLGTVSREKVKLPFEMNSSALSFAQEKDTTEYVSFEYRSLLPSTRPLRISLNDYTNTLNPVSGQNRFNVSSDHLEEDNMLTVESNGTYVLENLQVYSVETGGE